MAKLEINQTVDEMVPCSRGDAAAFYDSLDGYLELLDSLARLDDLDALGDWYADYNGWIAASWSRFTANGGTGISIMIQALEAHARHSILEQFCGDAGEIHADAALAQLRKMAVVDRAAMELNDSPEVDLEINRLARQIPRCGEDRALAYYATRDGYEKVTDALLKVDSFESLRDWLLAFQAWRNKDWGDFYARPCGAILGDMYYVESRTYLLALMHLVGEDVNQAFLELNMATLEKELRDRTAMGRHTWRTRRLARRYGIST